MNEEYCQQLVVSCEHQNHEALANFLPLGNNSCIWSFLFFSLWGSSSWFCKLGSKIRDWHANAGWEDCDSWGIKMVVKMLSHFGFEKPNSFFFKPEIAAPNLDLACRSRIFTVIDRPRDRK